VGTPCVQRQLDCAEDRLLIVLKDQRQDLGHLPVAASTFKEMALKLPECLGHLSEGCPIAQGARLALDDRQIVPPIVDGSSRQMMGPINDPRMFAQDLSSAAITIRSG